MDKKEIYRKLKNSPNNIRFSEICYIAELFGFVHRGGAGSHRVYKRKDINQKLNFQDDNGKAKPYQVRQLIKVIQNYNLLED
jgi:hypothetical protein